MANHRAQSSPAPAMAAEQVVPDAVDPVPSASGQEPAVAGQPETTAPEAAAHTDEPKPDAAIAHMTPGVGGSAPPANAFQWEIVFEIRRKDGSLMGEKRVNVTATTEAQAFDLAQEAVDAITDGDDPITWRFTGRFRKFAA